MKMNLGLVNHKLQMSCECDVAARTSESVFSYTDRDLVHVLQAPKLDVASESLKNFRCLALPRDVDSIGLD